MADPITNLQMGLMPVNGYKDTYLLELSRYVVLNPVRAHMVNDVSQW